MTVAVIGVAMLLLAGVLTRQAIPTIRTFYIPSSVVGGLFGLAIMMFWKQTDVLAELRTSVLQQYGEWPGMLIAIVFAAMLLQPSRSGASSGFGSAGREGLMVWIIGLGQTAVGCWVTWLILKPYFGSPDQYAVLIETGFVGGHGTAAAMGKLLERPPINLPEGLDLGLMMATFGLIYGILSGVVLINVGVRRGWVQNSDDVDRNPDDDPDRSKSNSNLSSNAAGENAATSASESAIDVDRWLVQAIYLAIAVAFGLAAQSLIGLAGQRLDFLFATDLASAEGSFGVSDELSKRTGFAAVLGSFPLFIYTLLGGWIVGRFVRGTGASRTLDGTVVSRLSSIAMDVLVVAAIASLNLTAVLNRAGPLLVLMVAGSIWVAIALLLLAPRILPRGHWFELGLINYGMSTGTTATGFVLLRMVDPKLRSPAARDYALAAPLSSPFIGGGMLTFAIPLFVLGRLSIASVTVVLTSVVAALITIGIMWSRRINVLAAANGN